MTLYEEARAALRESDFRPKKRLGQNFLVHQNVVEAILRLLDLHPEDEVLEIGPGLGFLTRRLVERAKRVWAIEVDPFLAERLKQSPLGAHPAFQLIQGDVLKVAPEAWLPPRRIKLVGNLPYSLSTPMLFRFFDWREHFSVLVLMVQKEVADRMASGPGSKEYGTLSVWCQVHSQITNRVAVSREAFFPRPKVRSTVLRLELYPQPSVLPDEIPVLRGLVRAAFGQRRKTLGNALSGWLEGNRREIEAFLRGQNIDPQRRGETLSVEEFVRLARAARGREVASDERK